MISYRDLIGRVRCFFIVQWIMGPGQTILLIRFTCWLLLGDTIYHRPHANPWRGGGNFISKGARLLFGQRAFQFQTEATFIFPISLGRLANVGKCIWTHNWPVEWLGIQLYKQEFQLYPRMIQWSATVRQNYRLNSIDTFYDRHV